MRQPCRRSRPIERDGPATSAAGGSSIPYDAAMRVPSLFLIPAFVALFSGCTSTVDQTSMPQPLLGSGHGIDHVTILTNDLASAADEYAKRLGFTVGPARAFSFGFEGANIYFADGTYIELYGVHDRAKVASTSEAFALEAPEGVTWVTLHAVPTAETASLLTQRGIPAWGPFDFPEDAKAGEWRFRLTGPEEPVLPGGRIYFVEYNEELRAKSRAEDAAKARAREVHENAAHGLRSVWVAVGDLSAAAARYESAGLIPGPEVRLNVLDANAREIRTPGGALLLVQMRPEPGTESGGSRDSFAGISIKTGSLDRIRRLIRESHSLELRPYPGLYGRSILVPARLARGASIEFFE